MDRNINSNLAKTQMYSRSLRGNVDRNFRDDDIHIDIMRRSLRGNVDRNGKRVPKDMEDWVVPYVGTWIEISRKEY